MRGLSSLQYSEVRWKIAPPFEHLKIKNNTKRDVTRYGFRGAEML